MRARSTNILDSTYITPVVQASSKTRAAMLMLAYNAPRKPQMCHNASPATHMQLSPPRGQSHPNMQLQARSRAPSPIYSQDTKRSGRDTCNDARTSRSKRDLVPRQRREQHQHAHYAQQARPPLLSRTASRACTLTAPGLSVRTVLRVVAVDLLRPRRLAADRAADGLHERCDIRATVDLQHDEQCVTASLPDAPGTAPQPSARRPRQHGDLVASFKPPSPREGAQGASLRFCPGLFYKVRV